MRRLVVTALALGLAACSMGKDVPIAENAIKAFHASLNAGDIAGIYGRSSDEMKQVTPAPKFAAFLGAVRRKLGAFRSGKALGWNDNVNPSGHFVSVNYDATYEHGQAAESFVYRISNDQATLARYHVNSDALILN